MSWKEDDIHRWLARASAPRAFVGSTSHDAAVTSRPKGRLVTCLDQCIEGVHVDEDEAPAVFGKKAANRALSDLAATAATANGLLLGLSAPKGRSERWIREVISGVRGAAQAAGADLWGGDLAATPGPARLSVTVLGECPASGRPVGRDRARVGQVVLCTGPLGGSRLGRHKRFQPRLDAGRRLARAGATAMMDVSDGLAWDLFRLARASHVRIELDTVPVHSDARRLARSSASTAVWHALHDGEDHELLATMRAADADRALAGAARRGEAWVRIGRVVRGVGLALRGDAAEGRERDWSAGEGGYRHGDD